MQELSKQLTEDFGKGFSTQSLWNMRQFYNTFQKLSTLWRELTYLVFTMEELKYDIR